MKKNKFLFAAMLCVALVFGFSACENPDDNEELLERIEQLENQLKDQQSGKDNDKDSDSADKDSDKDNSSDNEQNGDGTPDPDEGEEGGDEGGSSSSTTGTENGYEWVDLGLPSGLRWATCNVGATKPEEYGNYYAWGEVEPKSTYSWSTYKWMTTGMSSWSDINKYTSADNKTSGVWYDYYGNFIGDNKTVLDLEDDAAAVNMGGSWRMPTYDELKELENECKWTWSSQSHGYNVKGPNGNFIFLPAAGLRDDSGLHDAGSYSAGSYGSYWSSSLRMYRSDYAYNLYFYSDGVNWNDYYFDQYFYRCCGHSVRGVFSH